MAVLVWYLKDLLPKLNKCSVMWCRLSVVDAIFFNYMLSTAAGRQYALRIWATGPISNGFNLNNFK